MEGVRILRFTPKELMEDKALVQIRDNNPDLIDMNLWSQYSASQPDDIVYQGECLFPAAKSDSTSYLSSSSPPSSSDDLFQVNVNRKSNLTTSLPFPQVDMNVKPASEKDNEVYLISRNSPLSEKMDNDSPDRASISGVSDFDESSISLMSPTKSPPIQVMDRSSGYDPSRIPPSAFSRRKSSIPQEWSLASNESLFSIYIGNASFARENAVILDMHKSGELQKSRELPPQIPRPPSPIAAFRTDNIKPPSIPVVHIEKPPKETELSVAIEVADITEKNPVKPTPMDQNNGYKTGSVTFDIPKQINGERGKASPLPVRKKKRCCCSCFSCSKKRCCCSCFSCSRCRCSCFKCSWPSCIWCISCRWVSCHCCSCYLKKCCCCYS